MNNIEETTKIDIKNTYDSISLEDPETSNSSNTTQNKNETSSLSSNPVIIIHDDNNTNNDSLLQKIKNKLTTISDKAAQYGSDIIEKLNIQPSYKYFIICLTIGVIFILLSLFLLPVVILTPTKFVITFGIGNILILTGFMFYFGGKEFVLLIFNEKRRYITFVFLLSLLIGILLAWRRHFILSLLFAVFQMVTVIMFTLSFIPGGSGGINFMLLMMQSVYSGLITSIKNKFAFGTETNGDLPI